MAEPTRDQILAWYRQFRTQMMQDFGIDLGKKTSMLRIGSYRIDPERNEAVIDYPFMRHEANGEYTVPEPPAPEMEQFRKFVWEFNNELTVGRLSDQRPDQNFLDACYHNELALFGDRNRWLIANQSTFDPARQEDFDQIRRIYHDAHNGHLFLFDPDEPRKDSVSLYVGDDGAVRRGVPITTEVSYSASPDGRHRESAEEFYQNFHELLKGGAGLTEEQRQRAEWLRVRRPAVEDMTDRQLELAEQYRHGALRRAKPAPVPKPGVGSFLKRMFSFGRVKTDYVRYENYQKELQEWQEKLDAGKKFQERRERNIDTVEKTLLAETGLFNGLTDPDRMLESKQSILGAKCAISSIGAKDSRLFIDKSYRGPHIVVDLEADITSADVRLHRIRDAIKHPEFFLENGELTVAGKTHYLTRYGTQAELDDRLRTAREQNEAAMRKLADELSDYFNSREIVEGAAPANDERFVSAIGTAVYLREMERRLNAGEITEECFLSADDLLATGRREANRPELRAAITALESPRQTAFNLTEYFDPMQNGPCMLQLDKLIYSAEQNRTRAAMDNAINAIHGDDPQRGHIKPAPEDKEYVLSEQGQATVLKKAGERINAAMDETYRQLSEYFDQEFKQAKVNEDKGALTSLFGTLLYLRGAERRVEQGKITKEATFTTEQLLAEGKNAANKPEIKNAIESIPDLHETVSELCSVHQSIENRKELNSRLDSLSNTVAKKAGGNPLKQNNGRKSLGTPHREAPELSRNSVPGGGLHL